MRRADTLEYALSALPDVSKVSVQRRTAGVTVCYGGNRAELIQKLRAFSYGSVTVPENYLQHSCRELNETYKEKLVGKVLLRYGSMLFVPYPVRAGITILKSLRYIGFGIKTLCRRKLEVPVLDATAIGVSVLRGDMKTAGSIMFLLGIGELLEEWTHKKSVGDLARSMSLNISKVWRRKDGQEILVSVSDIAVGDEIVVRMGNVIPFDGMVVSGEGMVNQASLTRESAAVFKQPHGYATTLPKFRHMLEKNRIGGKIFADVNSRLDEAGLIMHGGTVVDASLIAAPKSTKNKIGKRDPEMHQTKKGNEWYFGLCREKLEQLNCPFLYEDNGEEDTAGIGLRYVRHYLERFYQGEAQNGKNALQFIQEHPVDLVFVDIDMPEMNGIEFMEECRKIKPDVQFVVLSFFENFSYVQTTLRLGGLDYISKTSMELDNGDTILQRIVEKFEQCICKTVPPEEMEKELVEIWKECRTQYWFFNDAAFERLKELMQEAEPKVSNVRRMEMMIVRYISELERMLELPESTVPLFSDVEEMAGWLTLYREKIHKTVSLRSFGNDAEMVLKAIFYMKEHLAENLSTSIAAEQVGCSRSYFCTIFKKFSGLSFGDFLQQIRIEHAKELLRTTSDSVTEVAFSSGYNNIYYFNRIFQKAENCSPTEFRKNRVRTGEADS